MDIFLLWKISGKFFTQCFSGKTTSLVGWQATLRDPIWQVTPRSSETTCSGELYHLAFNLNRY